MRHQREDKTHFIRVTVAFTLVLSVSLIGIKADKLDIKVIGT